MPLNSFQETGGRSVAAITLLNHHNVNTHKHLNWQIYGVARLIPEEFFLEKTAPTATRTDSCRQWAYSPYGGEYYQFDRENFLTIILIVMSVQTGTSKSTPYAGLLSLDF